MFRLENRPRCARSSSRAPATFPQVLTAGEFAASIAGLIDHTLLKPEASRADIEKLCDEALRFGFASVCINPWYVAAGRCNSSRFRGEGLHGDWISAGRHVYAREDLRSRGSHQARRAGNRQWCKNVGALKSGQCQGQDRQLDRQQDQQVELDMRGVVEASHRGGAICKVILETALLTNLEKVRASLAAQRAGADFVKTSTGFSSAGATVEDVALMRATVGNALGIKAAGGIRSLEDVRRMIRAGRHAHRRQLRREDRGTGACRKQRGMTPDSTRSQPVG